MGWINLFLFVCFYCVAHESVNLTGSYGLVVTDSSHGEDKNFFLLNRTILFYEDELKRNSNECHLFNIFL